MKRNRNVPETHAPPDDLDIPVLVKMRDLSPAKQDQIRAERLERKRIRREEQAKMRLKDGARDGRAMAPSVEEGARYVVKKNGVAASDPTPFEPPLVVTPGEKDSEGKVKDAPAAAPVLGLGRELQTEWVRGPDGDKDPTF